MIYSYLYRINSYIILKMLSLDYRNDQTTCNKCRFEGPILLTQGLNSNDVLGELCAKTCWINTSQEKLNVSKAIYFNTEDMILAGCAAFSSVLRVWSVKFSGHDIVQEIIIL